MTIGSLARGEEPGAQPLGPVVMWVELHPQARHAEPLYAMIEEDWVNDGLEHIKETPGWVRCLIVPLTPDGSLICGEGLVLRHDAHIANSVKSVDEYRAIRALLDAAQKGIAK